MRGKNWTVKFSEEGSAEQFSGGVIVAFAQGARHFESGLAIAATSRLSHGKQGIGDFGHGTDHHHGTVRQSALDDVGDAVNRFCVLYGSPAELHDDHGRGCSLRPDAYSPQRHRGTEKALNKELSS